MVAALQSRPPGPYALQAAIAAVHADAPSSEMTDWPQITALYGLLGRIAPSPTVELNRAIAVAMADGLAAGLRLLDHLRDAGELAHSHPPPGPTCCGAWAAPARPSPPTARPSPWSATTPNATTSPAAATSSPHPARNQP
ncbi:hypothetical protein ACFWB2_32850 [Streptomyces virginiae]|uniref:hypothetical protein n=1 Tax=Streptomyces virginiae TaxID=1961 RepID=UPI0036840392